MIYRAPAKINFGLHIKGKRADGFHELESIFAEVPLYDFIELIPSSTDSFQAYNIEIPGNPDKNLCIQALRLLRERGYAISSYDIHLLKNIPIGAGLGGGSSDAVAVLKGVNELENLKITNKELVQLSAELGSDCPFFCTQGSALIKGRGELITPIDFNLKGKYVLLVNPNIHISTAEAYGGLNLSETTQSSIDWSITENDWQENWINDFEKTLSGNYPALQRIKETLINTGANYASLSGSGSSVFGVFHTKPKKNMFTKEGYSEWMFTL